MRLLFSNLNGRTTTSHLEALLLPFGIVESTRLVRKRSGRHSEGMALVEIDYKAGHMVISELHNFRFMDCYIYVEETNV